MKVWGSCLVHLCFKLGVWGYLGCKLGGLGVILAFKLGGLWPILAPSWGLWGSFWLQLEGLVVLLGHLGSKLGVMGPSWLQVGGSWSI